MKAISMEYITSRSFQLPTDSKEFEEHDWFNMWQNQLFPYKDLIEEDILYWYDSTQKKIVWKTKVVKILKFPYNSKNDIIRKFKDVSDQAYFEHAKDKGYFLCYKVKVESQVEYEKPTAFRFPMTGWIKLDAKNASDWGINKKLPKPDWNLIITNPNITTEYDLSIFQALYSFEKHQAYASQIGLILGHTGKTPQSPINLEIGKYAKRIAQHFDIEFTKRESQKFKYWDLFFNGWDDGSFFIWQLKPEIVEALEKTKLTGIELISEEISAEESEDLFEGAKKTVTINAYERNPKARSICLKHWGTKCAVCGFDFEKVYGAIGKGFIHVHHLIPVSQIGKLYQIDPISDLKPVCPNCHAMIHLKSSPMTIDEMKVLIKTCR